MAAPRARRGYHESGRHHEYGRNYEGGGATSTGGITGTVARYRARRESGESWNCHELRDSRRERDFHSANFAITGNLGISPAAATFITRILADRGFHECVLDLAAGDREGVRGDYAVPTPSVLTTAIADMQLAFTDAAGRAPNVTELGAGSIGGMNLAPGVYKWALGS